MRTPKYLSPTSISLFLENPDEFYIKYLSDKRPPRDPQTKAMAVGSAFDAYVKSHLHFLLFGKGTDPRFEFNAIFEAQVEPQNRDEAREAGGWCFEWYRRLGAIADLMLDLNKAIGKPHFEIDLKGVISGAREGSSGVVIGVPFNGKPDCYFVTPDGVRVVLDWKVNGYYSNSPPSPVQGYITLREDGKTHKSHDAATLAFVKGLLMNTAAGLHVYSPDWARQLTIYGSMTGGEIGEEFVGQVEQIVCNTRGMVTGGKPRIRVATHRCFVVEEFQKSVFDIAAELWSRVTAPLDTFHFFRELSFEDSRAKCALLEKRAEAVFGSGVKNEEDEWFAEMTRKARS